MNRRVSLGLWGLLFASASASSAESLVIDASHTAVVFSWNHRGLSHPVARLENVAGTVFFDSADLTKSSVSVVMPLKGLRTGDADLDRRLRGHDFFDIARYPQITFTSTRIELDEGDLFRVAGNLTVQGITRPVTLRARINKIAHSGNDKITAGFDADATLRRSDFGLGRYVPMVSDELVLHITLEAAAE